jgi:beta-N-acetylhexosaminidase
MKGLLSKFGCVLLEILVFFIFLEVILKGDLVPGAVAVTNEYVQFHEKYNSAEIVGQHLIISIKGTQVDEETFKLLDEVRPGGIILFQSNIVNQAQTRKLTSDLQDWAKSNDLPPLFICLDQEGGLVQRIPFEPVKYSQRQLGEMDQEEITKELTRDIVNDLISLGVNVNFAPVVDIAYLPNSIMKPRSFGSTPEIVKKHLLWELSVYQEKPDLLPTLKHFPGHGRTTTDSHEIVPEIQVGLEKWRQTDAVPFEAAIEENVAMIMVGHIRYPQIDSEIATDSKVWLEEILRGEMGYDGLIVADDIKMGAVEKDPAQAAVSFLDAGNDLIIVAHEYDEISLVHEKLKREYDKMDLFEKRDEFWDFARIIFAKKNLKF